MNFKKIADTSFNFSDLPPPPPSDGERGGSELCKPSHFLVDQCDYKKKSLLSYHNVSSGLELDFHPHLSGSIYYNPMQHVYIVAYIYYNPMPHEACLL